MPVRLNLIMIEKEIIINFLSGTFMLDRVNLNKKII